MTSNRLHDVEVEVLHDDRWAPGWLDPTTWRKHDGRWRAAVRFQPTPRVNHLDVVDQDDVRQV